MKLFCFISAWFAFSLGIIGAFLPVVPTTPFLILSAFLFSKSSPKFHKWLLNLPLAGQGLQDWNDNGIIRPQAKALCSVMILGSLVFISLNQTIPLPIKMVVAAILVSVMIFVLTRNSRL
ncbi:MAG: YbaN family protein [Bacteriovoracaceae bacterium]|nr:YbaN family protein [Bacteriovoracaceae bacterium]